MTEEKILEKMSKMMLANNKVLLIAVGKMISESEQRTAEKINALAKQTTEAIKASQEDTIDTLSEVINTGYNLHDERIARLEEEVGLPPLGQKH